MTRGSHLASGVIANACITSLYFSSVFAQSFFSAGWFIAFTLAIMLGSTAPDWMEIPYYSKSLNKRISLIPHRTITHWWLLWIVFLLVVLIKISIISYPFLQSYLATVPVGAEVNDKIFQIFYTISAQAMPILDLTQIAEKGDEGVYLLLLGVAIGGNLHCLLDYMTPRGVPIIAPFIFKNNSLRLVSGINSEIGFLVFLSALAWWLAV